MTKAEVCIVDYGTGNIFSVAKSLELAGASVFVSSDPKKIKRADRLVLPGVGAFENGITALRQRGLEEGIIDFCEMERPFLGICLGMQFLATSSQEFGFFSGLNLIPGEVIQLTTNKEKSFKIPHIGWINLTKTNSCVWEKSILNNLEMDEEVYVVHSFHFVPKYPEHRLAMSKYGSSSVCVAVQKNNIIGCQFHPEKSGIVGLKILKNFVN